MCLQVGYTIYEYVQHLTTYLYFGWLCRHLFTSQVKCAKCI